MKRLITLFLFIFICSTCTVSACAPEPKKADIDTETVKHPVIEITIPEIEVKEERVVEYEYADYIWNYLKELGYNDYVCAGILGNMMVEVGGGTFELQPLIETKSHYGICQWNKKYYPDVVGVSLEEQCNFLRDNIQFEIDTFGSKYEDGFEYSNFIKLENEKDAALAFAKSYERCGSGGYEKRQGCATTAYEYFVG